MTDTLALTSVISAGVVGVLGVGATLRAAAIATKGALEHDKRSRYIEFETSLSRAMSLTVPPRGNKDREAELAGLLVLVQAQLVSLPLTGSPQSVNQVALRVARGVNNLARTPPTADIREVQWAYTELIVVMRWDIGPGGWRRRRRPLAQLKAEEEELIVLAGGDPQMPGQNTAGQS